MRISDTLVKKMLLSSEKATEEQIDNLRLQSGDTKSALQDLVIRSSLINENDLTRLYAEEIDVPFIELDPKDIEIKTLEEIPERVASKYKIIVYKILEDGTKKLATDDPDDVEAINFIKKQLGNNVHISIATTQNILACLDLYRGEIGSELTKVITTDNLTDEADEKVSEEDVAEDSPIAQTVNLLIEYAIKAGSSDIHIEPRGDYVSVRYRVDGVLKETNKLPKKVIAPLVSRIKILSNLKIDEKRAPQDGRFKITTNGQLYALRVSTLPIMDGEKVVMRLLNETAEAQSLEDLGYWGRSLDYINDAMTQPHGMILVTGPTGSGKSTSLFSILSKINEPSVNISTVEDPVEYRIIGANQTQVNPMAGMTFANGLRALLRQDPNIIMVGEIRDGETAGLAIQAALTGHLVFSTLHTNNAATTLPRLLDMGIEPFLIASTVRVVVGQRLLRRLCQKCKKSYEPNDQELQILKKSFKLDSDKDIQKLNELEQIAIAGGIGDINEPSTSTTDILRMWKKNDEGCSECNNLGYKGRIGIYEVLHNSESVQKLIVASATSETIEHQAINEGMVTMRVDGLIKALRGLTTVEEILRVTTNDE